MATTILKLAVTVDVDGTRPSFNCGFELGFGSLLTSVVRRRKASETSADRRSGSKRLREATAATCLRRGEEGGGGQSGGSLTQGRGRQGTKVRLGRRRLLRGADVAATRASKARKVVRVWAANLGRGGGRCRRWLGFSAYGGGVGRREEELRGLGGVRVGWIWGWCWAVGGSPRGKRRWRLRCGESLSERRERVKGRLECGSDREKRRDGERDQGSEFGLGKE